MIFFGRRTSKLGEFSINHTQCQYCENTDTQHITIFGKYAHVYWIPVFPLGKEVVSECNHCKRTISQKEFSNQLLNRYYENSQSVKRPFWHWSGIGLIALVIMLSSIMSATHEEDPRSELLDNDIEMMSMNPTMESDSVSYLLKTFFNDFTNEELNANEFEFLTKVKEKKVLILAKIPNLKKVEKEGREQAIEMIELIANSLETIKDKEKYIGVHGRYNMMMVKTPSDHQNSFVVSETALYDFYGHKQEFAEN